MRNIIQDKLSEAFFELNKAQQSIEYALSLVKEVRQELETYQKRSYTPFNRDVDDWKFLKPISIYSYNDYIKAGRKIEVF